MTTPSDPADPQTPIGPPQLPPTPSPEAAAVGLHPPGRAERIRLFFEIAVVLALAVMPDLFNALAVLFWPINDSFFADAQSAHILIRSFQVVLPLLYLAWRSGETWPVFGIVRPRIGIDLGIGFLLFVVSFVVVGVAHNIADQAIGSLWQTSLDDRRMYEADSNALLLLLSLACNSIAEEFAIWGVLFTRLRRLSGNDAMAILLSAGVFASYHVYQGSAAAAAVCIGGILHGIVFRLTGRLWPLIIAHTATNFALVMPYLGR